MTEIKMFDAILPNRVVTGTRNPQIALHDFPGQNVVIFFYPKDNTSGCSQEVQDFRDLYEDFLALNTQIFGISRDSVKSHQKFIEKYGLPFDLISDSDESLCQLFATIKAKQMYGRAVRGIERSTFLFDPSGKLAFEWRGVKVPNHAMEVLDKVKALSEEGVET